MAAVTWSPELRLEVKKHKLFGNRESDLHADCTVLTTKEQNAIEGVFSNTTKETKEPKYDYWF